MGRKGRGRKRGEEDESESEWQAESGQQTHNLSSTDQDSFNCPIHHSPVPSRYLTRHSKAVLGQDSSSRYPIRSTRRIPSDSEIPILTQATPNQTGTPRLAKRGKKINNFNYISKSNTSNDEAELESLYSKVIFPQTWAQPAAASRPAPHEVVSDNHRPIKEANEVPNIVGSTREGSASNCNQGEEHLDRTSSLNLTGMAEMLDDDCCDLNEVGSSLDTALVTVNGYRVKPEWAALLRAIFSKHGDIAKDCSLLSNTPRSSLLEIISNIVQKLQATKFTCITPVDLKSMLDEVQDLETVKMEVGWLRERLDDIFEAMRLFRGYSTLKEAQRSKVQVIEKKVEEIKSLKEKIFLAEDELTPMKAEAEKIDETVSETKAKVKCFYQKSLVHGLF